MTQTGPGAEKSTFAIVGEVDWSHQDLWRISVGSTFPRGKAGQTPQNVLDTFGVSHTSHLPRDTLDYQT